MGSDDDMYLYLYHLPTGKKQPVLHSLKIKIPNKYIILNSGSKNTIKRISKEIPKDILLKNGFENVSTLNTYLQEKLEDFIKVDGIKEYVDKNNKTLNEWFEILISGMYNQGTILRYKNVKNLLESFQNQRKGTNIIYLKDLDRNFILQFQKWLLSEPKSDDIRKSNSLNSTTYKLKCLKSVVNKCNTSKFYSFVENPFDFIEFKEVKRPYEVLSLEELQRLMNTELIEVYRRKVPTKDGVDLWGKEIEGGVEVRNQKNKRYKSKHTLNDIRNYFLFQVFSQGIRVSDLITLRWENFYETENNDLRIIKVMVKTREEIRILVNYNMTSILYNYLKRYSEYFKEDFEIIESYNKTIEYKKNDINEDIYLSIPTDESFWEYIPNEYNEILQKEQSKRKIDNTLIKVYKISESFLNEVKTLKELNPNTKLVNVDVDITETSLKEINKKIKNLKERIVKTENESLISDYNKSLNRLKNQVKEYFYDLIKKEFQLKKDKVLEKRNEEILSFIDKRHKHICKVISLISVDKKLKKEFVFELLDNKHFSNVSSDDFSRINEDQYRKFQSSRTYYNGLLKIIGSQCGISKRLSSHTSRHTFTSLMIHLIDNVSPYDLMNSLGHKHITTTQLYMKKFNDKNVDRLNQLFPKNVGYI
jgi:integrase